MKTMSIEGQKGVALYKARDVLRKYLLDDCLRAEYDGMTALEIVRLVVKAYEDEMDGQMVDDMAREYELANEEEYAKH